MDTDDLKHQHCTADDKHSPECVIEQLQAKPKAIADAATLSEARELKRALLTEMFPPTYTELQARVRQLETALIQITWNTDETKSTAIAYAALNATVERESGR